MSGTRKRLYDQRVHWAESQKEGLMAIDRDLLQRMIEEVASEYRRPKTAELADAEGALSTNPRLISFAMESRAMGGVSVTIRCVMLLAFLVGRRYEVAATLAALTEDSGEKTT